MQTVTTHATQTVMTYVCINLDADSQKAVHDAAEQMARSSPFISALNPAAQLGTHNQFHAVLLGALHVHSDEAVASALKAAGEALPLRGRFVKWECGSGPGGRAVLRLAVQLDGVDAFIERLHATLPRGRPAAAHGSCVHVVVGSLAAVDASQHDAFLQAVRDAFPIAPGGAPCAAGSLDCVCTASRAGGQSGVLAELSAERAEQQCSEPRAAKSVAERFCLAASVDQANRAATARRTARGSEPRRAASPVAAAPSAPQRAVSVDALIRSNMSHSKRAHATALSAAAKKKGAPGIAKTHNAIAKKKSNGKQTAPPPLHSRSPHKTWVRAPADATAMEVVSSGRANKSRRRRPANKSQARR